MRPDGVVVTAPAFGDYLGFPQRVEKFTIEQFVPQAGVKAALPGTAGLDISGFCANSGNAGRNRVFSKPFGRLNPWRFSAASGFTSVVANTL